MVLQESQRAYDSEKVKLDCAGNMPTSPWYRGFLQSLKGFQPVVVVYHM